MEVRTQLAIVGLVAGLWGASVWVRVHPLFDRTTQAERMSLAALEARVARHPTDVIASRVLLRRYLDHGMPRLVTDTAAHSPTEVQHDGLVSLLTARAEESLGHVTVAVALVNGALGRCTAVPEDLTDAAGCDVRTQTELAIESAALDRMTRWNVTPVSDPARASVAHELATRPVRISTRVDNTL